MNRLLNHILILGLGLLMACAPARGMAKIRASEHFNSLCAVGLAASKSIGVATCAWLPWLWWRYKVVRYTPVDKSGQDGTYKTFNLWCTTKGYNSPADIRRLGKKELGELLENDAKVNNKLRLQQPPSPEYQTDGIQYQTIPTGTMDNIKTAIECEREQAKQHMNALRFYASHYIRDLATDGTEENQYQDAFNKLEKLKTHGKDIWEFSWSDLLTFTPHKPLWALAWKDLFSIFVPFGRAAARNYCALKCAYLRLGVLLDVLNDRDNRPLLNNEEKKWGAQ